MSTQGFFCSHLKFNVSEAKFDFPVFNFSHMCFSYQEKICHKSRSLHVNKRFSFL